MRLSFFTPTAGYTLRTNASTANDGNKEHKQDQLLYLDTVREIHLMAMSKIEHQNSEFYLVLHKLQGFKIGDWECMCVWS